MYRKPQTKAKFYSLLSYKTVRFVVDVLTIVLLYVYSRDTGIGHLTKNYVRPIYLLPKKTSFRKVHLLVQRLINNYEIEREVI